MVRKLRVMINYNLNMIDIIIIIMRVFRIHLRIYRLLRSAALFQLPSCRASSGTNLVPFSIKLLQDAFIRPNEVATTSAADC